MDNRAGVWFVSAMDLQVLIGIILYLFLSPTTRLIMQNFSGAMSNGQARYFGVEHVILMIVALMVAHMGRVFVRRAPTAILKHRRTLFWFVLAILIVLAAVPWPFLMYGRPLI